MAFRRSLTSRATIIARRYQPSFAYALHEDDRKNQPSNELQSYQNPGNFAQGRSFGTGFSNSSSGFGVLFQDRMSSQPSFFPSSGGCFYRHMSTTVNDKADKFELIGDVAEVLKDGSVEAVASQAPAVSEVAIAAADCWLPVATLQYAIDAVHSFTGLNWWAAIAVTTLLIRGATLPLLINQLKATSKMTLMRPRLEQIREHMTSKGGDPQAMAEGQYEMTKLFKEYGVTPFTPLKGLFIQGPIFVSFYIAITTMAEKMPSFKCGGAYWFTDLTTPDSLYVLPVLTALTFLITVECNMQEGMEGNPAAATMKNVSRVIALLTVPFTMSFPKAIFCYWITSNLFSLSYGLVLKAPGVKKALGIPEIPNQPAATSPRPSIDLYSALKQTLQQARTAAEQSASGSSAPTKVSNRSTSSSSSTIRQRIKQLEKQVKGRKKSMKSFPCKLLGILKVPTLVVSDARTSMLMNLIALKSLSDFINDSAIKNCICFIASLIQTPQDVKESRVRGVLHNYLGSDEKRADLFRRISRELMIDDRENNYEVIF
ncbi:ARABIDOPSIS THALIANA HOMOLOG OF YEAST OXIDASE ASSEMBLY 1 (OXA1) [Hibiscus trionum]|uniref:ARABIDOPSIS THALIANA HOMOLOG OF YEAST OXIDASE ASSEMBLY 1 (OXA1) n=1 Tax=Hibiscus trionum TaxID=183268 RepID=A0A9W7JG26_HIBTR|nr:ARABIDOPSIS THALIANA HOMOLOG OF YEAST OXIDASE ASSEMBLY 1 (OXA1) [Hibiscus trionum]